ncbi:MAG: hypothetical protein RR630_02005 [Coprobacillus sp.]
MKAIQEYFLVDGISFPKNIEEMSEEVIKSFVHDNKFNLQKDIKDVFVNCRHFTTVLHTKNSIAQLGLMTLDNVLEKETDLKKFLYENNITFDISNKKMFYSGSEINISDEKNCEKCFIKGQCEETKVRFKDIFSDDFHDNECEYIEIIKELQIPIYHYKGEIEGFLFKEDPYNTDYSCVNYCPEILGKIEKVIKKLFNEDLSLRSNWQFSKNRTSIYVDFKKSIFDFEDTTINDDLVGSLFEYYKDNREEKELLNLRYNLFIIVNALNALYVKNEKFFQLKPRIQVLPNELKISLSH